MSQFNLIEEKWIPVQFPDGTSDELGIHDTLLRSKEIKSIEDPSPLIVAALHRFLLAILYRAIKGPTDIDQAKSIFHRGLPAEKITAYLEKWWNRFWLLDDKYPFGQNLDVPKNAIEPWTKLTAEYNATSNKVLFDHTDTRDPGAREPKECACWLLSTLTFSIAGGRGYYPSPSPNAMMCIPLGRNLEQTLCYSLVPYPNRKIMFADSALWEREPKILPSKSPKRTASGYADLYTWQSRRIRFENFPSDKITIMRFAAGEGFENPANSPDPMQPHKTDKKKGNLPVQFKEDRGTWRDFDSLLPDNTGLAPLTIQNALNLAKNRKGCMPESVLVLGLKYTPPSANVDFWRMERFVLPQALVEDRYIRHDFREILIEAEKAGKSLWNGEEGIKACLSSSIGIYAKSLLSREERDVPLSDIKSFAKSANAIPWYWSTLEAHFHEILVEYTIDRNAEEIRCQWLRFVRETLRRAWDQHRTSVSTGDIWAIRALVKAEGPVRRKLKDLENEITKLKL